MHKFYTSDYGYTDAEFRNNGVLADPDQDATFYVEIYDSDDVLQDTYTLLTTPAIEQIETGAFKVEVFPLTGFATGGIGYAKWYAKVGGEEIEPYPFIDYWGQLLPSPTGYNLCSLEDLKWHLNITRATDDTQLGNLILRATAFIERYCDREFMSREHTEYHTGDGTARLKLNHFPVTAISSIADSSEFATFSYDDGDEHEYWDCEYDNGIVQLLYEAFPKYPPRAIEVIYTAGYATAPEDLKQLCVELAAARYHQRNRQGIVSTNITGAAQTTYRNDELSPMQLLMLDGYGDIVTGAV